MSVLPRLLMLLSLPLSSTGSAWAQSVRSDGSSGDVRIYRCITTSGTTSLQSIPCESGRPQQVLDMQRPRDPLTRPTTTLSTDPARAAAAPAPLPQREIRIVSVQPPQPMYECVTSDGQRYTSDDNAGNPRWVPLWAFGYADDEDGRPRGRGPDSRPPGPPGPPVPPGPPSGAPHSPGPPPPPHVVYPGAGVIVPAGSTLVRDTCTALPRQEVCARLTDRRWELIRRYNSALQSERRAMETEQRGIDARLARDCGGN